MIGGSLKDGDEGGGGGGKGIADLSGLLDGILKVLELDVTESEVLVEVDPLRVQLVREEAEPFLVELDRRDIVLGLDPVVSQASGGFGGGVGGRERQGQMAG